MVSIMVSAFNEEKYLKETISNVIEAAKAAGDIPLDIIIVNDGSTDCTGAMIQELEMQYPFVRSIHHQKNLGLGRSVKEAIQVAKYPQFLIVPGDNDLTRELITDLLSHKDKADVIISFFLNKEIRGRLRNVISMVFGIIYMSVFNIFVQSITAPSIFPTEKLRRIVIKSSRFSIVTELIIKLLKSGCTFYEVPGYVQTGSEGSSSLSFGALKEVIQTFVKLVYEIKINNRSSFNKNPVRIY